MGRNQNIVDKFEKLMGAGKYVEVHEQIPSFENEKRVISYANTLALELVKYQGNLEKLRRLCLAASELKRNPSGQPTSGAFRELLPIVRRQAEEIDAFLALISNSAKNK